MDPGLLQEITGGIQGVDSIINAFSDISAGNFAAQQFQFNESLSKIQGEEALSQGQFEQQISQQKTAQLSGEQVAAEAAQGADVHGGTATITKEQTGEIGGLDYLTIGNNAMMKAIGFEIQGANDASQAWQATDAGWNKAGNSLLSGSESMMQSGIKAQAYDIPEIASGEGAGTTVDYSTSLLAGSNIG